ncbi:hypothetical protein E1176_09620, partial [Fulvivirga sp. RKSG066]|uniref:KAP family P-loop NTPase fold protein n=1 Tax=Fulvivirga aurantia TaxID=2529383 RepID=UPI0012BD7AFC
KDEPKNYETDADLLHDNPSNVDDLGRDFLMEVVANKIDELWSSFNPNDKYNYTVLVDGEWGSGKTSMLGFLEKHLLKKEWKVVHYNAWENQRLEDQWWVFINKVSKTLSKSHFWWSFWLRNTALFVTVILLSLIVSLYFKVFGDLNTLKTVGVTLGVLVTLSTTVWGLLRNFFGTKINSSELLKSHTSDPYKPIKERFNKVTKDQKVAIFIDDLDRCEAGATVELLEGIQNLFKGTRVLYVIAADGNWISTCFTNKYKDFDGLGRDGHSIGNKFLQKSFQLVLEVPKMSLKDHNKMWYQFLGNTDSDKSTFGEKDQEEINEEIRVSGTTSELKEAVKGAGFEGRKKAAEKVEELVEEQKDHLLMEFVDYMPKNIRQMKRLVNQYVVKYQALFIAGNESEISDEDLVRYVIFAINYPDFDSEIKRGQKNLEEITKKSQTVRELIGESLTTKTIVDFL